MDGHQIHRGDGSTLNASFALEVDGGSLSLLIASRGGAKAGPGARNADYAEGLQLILARLRDQGARIADAMVDSEPVRQLSFESRRLHIAGNPYPITIVDPIELQRRLGAAMARIGRSPGAKGSGNSTKRLRLVLDLDRRGPAPSELAGQLSKPSRASKYWAFAASPERYRIDDAVADLEEDMWTVGDSDVRRGDRVAIWRTKGRDGRRGVIALGQVLTDPSEVEETPNSRAYWTSAEEREPGPRRRVLVRYELVPGLPLWNDGANPAVADLSVARARGGSTFIIRPEQWATLMKAFGGVAAAAQAPGREKERLRRLARGQGFLGSSAVRGALEECGMARARRYFEDLGYAVADVHQSQPYDLECSKAGDIRCCEVKATTTLGVEVLLTPNEVRFARENKARMVLYVLHSVSVEEHESKAVAQGGEPFVVWPWDVDSGALEPLGYSHTVPGDRHRLAAPQ